MPPYGLSRYDSFVANSDARAGQQVHCEYIVFDRTQVYPEFLVHYKVA
jgi:hypothetical protein